MDNPKENSWIDVEQTGSSVGTNAFLRQVYAVMAFGLAITGMTAWFAGNKLLDGEWLFLVQGPLRWIIMLAPLGFVFALSAGVQRMSFNTVNILFAAFATVMGLSLAYIFVIYTGKSIYQTFLITAGTFAAMSLVGMTTKVDLSKFGSILYMALIGIIIASVVNWFMQSAMFDYIISFIGVGLFCGLTAYDTQKLLVMGQSVDPNNEQVRKYAVMGALSLYLDFINLFLFLLRFFGSRD